MKAVFLDYGTMGTGLSLASLQAVTSELIIHDVSNPAELAGRIMDVDAVLTNKTRLTAALIAGAPRLRFIGLTATGTDNVDTDAAAKHGVAVANIRAYCTESVVEHVFGVLLMLTHNLAGFQRSVRDGRWQKSREPFLLDHPIRELSAMTLGIVGYGSLGRGVAAVGKAFGMNVIVAARRGSVDLPDGRLAFDDVVKQSDVITLHCPLNDDTRGLFGAARFRQMRRNAFLVNTARGGLVDSAALVDALESGTIAGAAVDVLPQEPPVDGDPLLDYKGDNLLVTPHIAWATNEARQNAIDELAKNIESFVAGEKRNRVV